MIRPEQTAINTPMPENEWLLADEYTREVVPGAVFMKTMGGPGTLYVRYDLSIVKNEKDEWIPVHGSVKMPATATAEEAAAQLDSYYKNLPDSSKLRWDAHKSAQEQSAADAKSNTKEVSDGRNSLESLSQSLQQSGYNLDDLERDNPHNQWMRES